MPEFIHFLTNRYAVIDPLFGRSARPVELDLGTGKGGFLVTLAVRYPERLVLGSDVMVGRLRKVENKVRRAGAGNIELLRADSQELIGFQLPDGCVDRVHLLCPDPWPKKRHRDRRLVTTDFATRLARVLRRGGAFHFSTDDVTYFEQAAGVLGALDATFRRDQDLACIADIADIQTDFERLWLHQGRRVPHLAFVRR